ncbi:MAG TPA: hypothetical protein VIU44_07750, partial [Gaiellaceae bacterium]
VILLGKTRSGKSSKARLIVEHCLERGQPVGIIDPKGDWWGIKLSASGRSAGFPVVIFGGEHADVKINEHSGAQVADLVATGNRPFLIDLGGWMPSKRTKFFVDFASAFFVKTRGRRVLAIDEVHNFAPQGRVLDPDAGKALHWANRLASEGGGKGITLISASQRPQKVHKDFVTSHETLIACKVIHKLDRDAVKDWIDGCGDPEHGREVFKTLGNLKRNEAWVWSPEIEFGPTLVQFPMFKTYDSFKPQDVDDAARLKGWASVDLDEINQKFAAVIAEAKANDPRELKAQIARLTADLAKKPAAAPVVDEAAVAAAEKRGAERGYLEGVAVGRRHIVSVVDDIRKDVERHYAAAQRLADEAWDEKTPPPRPAPTVKAAAPPRAVAPVARVVAAPTNGGGEPASLPRAERKVMTALAQYPDGRTKAQVAVRAGYAVNGGGFNNAISALRTKGFLSGSGDNLVATPNGLHALGPYDPLPTGAALVRRWLGQLGKAERAALEALAQAYPGRLAKADVAAAAGYEPNGGGFNNALSRLRTLELMTGRGDDLAASDNLFG